MRGPPGTGKTRTASVSSALRLAGADNKKTPRVLAVTHFEWRGRRVAGRVHLAGVNAIRAGRPTAVAAPSRWHSRSDTQKSSPRKRANNASLPAYVRSDAMRQACASKT